MPTKRRRLIGVFGGSFNPPHYGHLFAAVYALKQFDLDEVWFVPAYEHAFGKKLTAFRHREHMLKQLIHGLGKHFRISTVDRSIKNPGKTWETLTALQKMYPAYQFKWVIGSDLLPQTRRWFRNQDIKKKYGYLLVPRGKKKYDFYIPDISSTLIRTHQSKKIASSKMATFMPTQMANYIDKNRLY